MIFDEIEQLRSRRDMSPEHRARIEKADQLTRQMAVLLARGDKERAQVALDTAYEVLFPRTEEMALEDYLPDKACEELREKMGIYSVADLAATSPQAMVLKLGGFAAAEIFQVVLKGVAAGKIRC